MSPEWPMQEHLFTEAELIELGRAKPGIFIEECRPNESTQDLTEDEYLDYVLPVQNSVPWHGIGWEEGRQYDHFGVKADVRDMGILDVGNWAFWGPHTPEHRAWAIEFFHPKERRYVRRRFWFKSKFCVAELTARFKEECEQQLQASIQRRNQRRQAAAASGMRILQ